jgi:hypothetical protein
LECGSVQVVQTCFKFSAGARQALEPFNDVEVVQESERSADLMSELAMLLTEFASHEDVLSEIMNV